NTKASLYQLIQQFNQYDFIPIDLSIDVANEKISNVIPAIQNIQITCDDYVQQIQHLPAYFAFRKFKLSQKTATQNLIQALIQIKCDEWCAVFETYYINQAILKIAMENGIKDDSQKLYEELVLADIHCKQKLAEKINHTWKIMQQESIKTKDLTAIKYLYNQRKNKQFSSKNSLRKIVHQDFDFFTTLFPVVMVNPSVCTSILPLQKNLFDFIVLDEASQLRVEDTYSSLLRGKTKIISGDKHQMPPSNFFGSETIFWNKEEEDDADSYLAESKSLLEYAEDANFKSTYLDYHYRSLHPSLIQFSNHAFYQSRLIPLPEKENYQAIHFTSVDGIYKDGTNIAEANAIVDLVFSLESWKDNFPSVGIATFNIFQRDLIYDLLFEQAYKDNAKNEKLQALLNQGLFVKNLENIQGDERDVMILSSTFGKDEQGKFRQFFGPLTQEKGYQLLNVIITRAKHSLHVYTSVPETTFSLFEEELAIKGNKGKSIFYAYLSYVKACVDKNQTQIDYIKSCLQKNNPPMLVHKKQRTSILKESVFNALQNEFGENVQLNFALGGFVLDIVLLKDNKPYLHIDFENTNLYHHEVTYRIKLHQQKIVEQYHIKTYHLWSYNWWNAAENEIKNISDCYLSN
ncbi:MAG TPA: DEAD/DEAH box helicase, partial [Chitinophagales bacterium]|nr:DEAD/DEAH box helicase [Chitinophagales bacterium]